MTRPWRIGIVNFPLVEAGVKSLSHMLDILGPLSNKLHLIAGNAAATLREDYDEVDFNTVNHKTGKNPVTRATSYFMTQLRIAFKLISLSKKVDLWVFFPGGEAGLLLPMVTAKLIRSRVILCLGSSDTEFAKARKDRLLLLLTGASRINLALCSRIILFSDNLIDEWKLDKYESKILIADRHFLDFDKFKILKPLKKRSNLVGYIGRLSLEKGILSFVEAISKVYGSEHNVNFLIGGEGPLRDNIEKYLIYNDLSGKVKLTGWIPYHELPRYLNELKLLVLPSSSEALPNIMLEAMACGTPVLATPVGAIPNVIKDCKTGFIIEDSTPECIAGNILRALNHAHLQEIVQNARNLVTQEFTYANAVERWQAILSRL